jgi:hypothetical protein
MCIALCLVVSKYFGYSYEISCGVALDRVNWTKLMQILKENGIDWRGRRLISKLYMDQNVNIQLDQVDIISVKTGRGVRQGYCLSPIILIYRESTLPGMLLRVWKLQKNSKSNSHC